MREESQGDDPDDFVLIRILGNDLPPRHEAGQTAANLRFVLDHEPPLVGCLKIWLLNRIVDPAREAELTHLLDRHGARYHRIPFEAEAYGSVGWDFESFSPTGYLYGQDWEALAEPERERIREKTYAFKNLYVMNNNGARNHALALGRSLARWVLPFDGNCFFTASAWDRLRADVRASAHLPYFVVPMTRVLDNSALLDPDFKGEPSQEPQILFRRDAQETFDERYRYGTRPKVALLMRLGVPGVWDRLAIDPWEPPRPAPSPDVGRFAEAGWVARLSSGHPEQEEATLDATRRRNLARRGGIVAMLDGLDERLLRGTFDADRLLSMPEERLAAAATGAAGWGAATHLIAAADAALGRGPYSVVQKTQAPPSGDPHDYWHPAPHWWPNPATADGLPPIHRDGERLPGTRVGEPGSEQYDRDRLQALFDETWTLALAWRLTGRAAYADHAVRLVRTWFLDPDTRMSPHLTYAQVRFGDDAGDGTGLIEFKDLFFFLDAVRLLRRSGAFRDRDQEGFRSWLGDYAGWLDGSPQGKHARTRPNNLGTYYDLQRLAVAAYLDDARGIIDTLKASRYRLTRQFDRDGAQPLEARRANLEHYGLFNLEGWFALATLAGGCGIDLWTCEDRHGGVLRRAFGWLARHHAQPEPPAGRTPVDPGRYAPLWYGARRHLAWDEPMPARVEAGIRHAFSGSGCLPYWTLAWGREAPTGP